MLGSKVKFEVGQLWRDGKGFETRVVQIASHSAAHPVQCDNGEWYTLDGQFSTSGAYAKWNLIALVALADGTQRDHRDIQSDPMGLLLAQPTIVLSAVAPQEDSHEALTFHTLPAAQPDAPTDQVKLSNPKDAIGDTKVPVWLCSAIAKAHWALGQFAGLCKYGAWNWRVAGVRASVYISAMGRHIDAYTNGERLDPTDGTHHLGNVMACCAILLEAEAIGKLTDDRPPRADIREAYAEVQAGMAKLKVLYADKAPKHWTIADEVAA